MAETPSAVRSLPSDLVDLDPAFAEDRGGLGVIGSEMRTPRHCLIQASRATARGLDVGGVDGCAAPDARPVGHRDEAM